MRIALEADILTNGSPRTGFGVYLDSLIKALAKYAPPDFEFILMHARNEWSGPDYGERFRTVSYKFTSSQFAAIAFRLNSVLKREKIDLFHVTCTTGVPPFVSVPVVTTVHDVFYDTFVMKRLYSWMRKNTSVFICNSEFTAKAANIPDAEIIYPGTQLEDYVATPPPPFYSKKPYFLCVGAIEPRKGQLMLAEAYLTALEKADSASASAFPDMIFVGPDRGDGAKLRILADAYPEIRYFDFVDTAELASLYAGATMFIAPSFIEGFGIPIVESMAFGVPSLCSDISVFRETSNGIAAFAEPNVAAFTDALLNYREIIAEFDKTNAHERFNKFTWKNNALKTLEIYKRFACQ